MSTEELLKPRYKVIADYPESIYKVGSIKEYDKHQEFVSIDQWINIFNAYPAIFKKLEWWEERSIEDMPEYLKYLPDGSISRIIKWDMELLVGHINERHVCSLTVFKPQYGYVPATEQECLQYQNSLK